MYSSCRCYHSDWLTELEWNLRAEASGDGGTLTSGVFSSKAAHRGTSSTSAGAVETIECELKVAGLPRPNRVGQDSVTGFQSVNWTQRTPKIYLRSSRLHRGAPARPRG